jgi:hypothetical protein
VILIKWVIEGQCQKRPPRSNSCGR